MQFLFHAEETPQAYTERKGVFPEAPERCPHKECHTPIKMRKHGFYSRYVATGGFIGVLRIRRYKCLVCGRTVSMLPSFCVPRQLYSVQVIIMALLVAAKSGSTRYAANKWPGRLQTLTRRHIIYYRKRILCNRGRIQLALNLMSPGFVELKQIAGDSDWTREFLKAAKDMDPTRFNAAYHSLTGNSFMSLHNNVA